MITVNLRQAQQLVEIFGGEDSEITVREETYGHSGPGLYAYFTEYPEEGAFFLEAEEGHSPRKSDGTPDRRYRASQSDAASGHGQDAGPQSDGSVKHE